ncbi:unnamed protein product [Enterobius vermicularis]|uniref:Estradiol 17-beta-dehydrogenase 2 n=1 Tax=Enterobius vermicularis TaxID=51028 RepID=A0A0N4V565_ENTVE|nr:unnamed protein product [Enterobius vermicularis]
MPEIEITGALARMLLILLASFVIFLHLLWWFFVAKLSVDNIEKRAVLVTGSGSGFGKAFVGKCLDEGMTVFAGCHRQVSADKLIEEFKGKKGHLEAFQMDVTSDESVNKTKEFIEKKLQTLKKEFWAVVNNAGAYEPCLCDAFADLDLYKRMMEVNGYGVIRVTHAFRPLIKRSK